MKLFNFALVLSMFLAFTMGCQESTPAQPEDFTGQVDRVSILEGDSRWANAFDELQIDEEHAVALSAVEPGAHIDVYLGVWCPDSVREVTRLWKALDMAGEVPFSVDYLGLDRTMKSGVDSIDDSVEQFDIITVPTFIVYRGDEEVGRVIEKSPTTIEKDLLDLLTGERKGKISATR